MSDSGSGGNQFVSEVKSSVGEVVEDIKDSVGEAIEQGVKSVVGSPLTSTQAQQKQAEDQAKLAKVRRDIAWMKNVDESQKQVRYVNQQKEAQKQDAKQQEKAEKVQITQVKQTKQNNEAVEAQRRAAAELKMGKGVGG